MMGDNAGNFISDAIRNIQGQWTSGWTTAGILPTIWTSGAISTTLRAAVHGFLANNATSTQSSSGVFDASNVVPTSRENRPASLSVNVYIAY